MADLPEVERALLLMLARVVYPNGTAAPSAIGSPVKLYRGWPDPDTLTRDLALGMCHVSIYQRGGVSSVAPDALTRWEDEPRGPPSLTVAAAEGDDPAVTFAGTAAAPLMIATIVEDRSRAWTHVVAEDDDPAAVAAALAALISEDRPASSSGATLTLPGATTLEASIAVGGTARRRIRTQRQGIQVALWCPRPALRDALGGLLDRAVAEELRLPVEDGTVALLHYNGTMSDDGTRAQPLYRRDLLLAVDYATVIAREVAAIAVIPIGQSGGVTGTAPIQSIVIH